MNTLVQLYRKSEEFLGNLPRIPLLLIAVYFMRNPFVAGHFVELEWYFKWPAEFLVLLLLAFAVSAGLRLAMSHGNESPADQSLARAAAKPAPSPEEAKAGETKPGA